MSSSTEVESELIVTGYIHMHSKNQKVLILMELFAIILIFYPKRYFCYGIGKDQYNQFALTKESEEYQAYEKWMYLREISKLLEHPSFIQCYNDNVFIRNSNNEIYAIGNNENGELGIDDAQNDEIETLTKLKLKIEDGLEIDIMSTGQFTNHSFVVLKDNAHKQIFYSFGKNYHEQQGHGSAYNLYRPTQISLNGLFKDIQIKQISTGRKHSLFLSVIGRVYSCGCNDKGQCGITLDDDDPFKLVEPQMVPFLYDVTKICCGANHNLCIDKNEALWCFGHNTWHQLGLGIE